MKKIIYIEDDKDTANACKEILKKAGYDIEIAKNGKLGLKAIRNKKYDLALIDIMLPDMSGWDIFQKIKVGEMKCAFLSALEVSKDRLKQLKKDGLSEYIVKPFTKKGLTKKVARILE